MRFLISSILLLLGCFACSPKVPKGYAVKELGQKSSYSPKLFTDGEYFYKANVEAYGNTMGGIMVLKKTGINYRVAMTTQFGNKLLDMQYDGADFKVNYILEDLNRKIILNTLKKDFSVLFKDSFTVDKVFTNGQTRILQAQSGKETVRIGEVENKLHFYWVYKGRKKKRTYSFTDGQISVKHHTIKLNLELLPLN